MLRVDARAVRYRDLQIVTDVVLSGMTQQAVPLVTGRISRKTIVTLPMAGAESLRVHEAAYRLHLGYISREC